MADEIKYSTADKKKIKQLTAADVALTGTESPEELDTLLAELSLVNEKGTEQEIIPGVPNKLPVRTEPIVLGGKEYQMAIFYVSAVKGGSALYDYEGRRVSPAYGVGDILAGSEGTSPTNALQYINKAAARFNSQRRRSFIPGDAVV